MRADLTPMTWTRTGVLALTCAAYLAVAEILAAILVLTANGVAPGCDSCDSGGGDSSFWFAVLLCAVVVWWGLVLVLKLCLGPHRAQLGATRIALLALIVIPLPPLGLLLGAQAHLSGRPSWIVPIMVSVGLGLAWVAVVRRIQRNPALRFLGSLMVGQAMWRRNALGEGSVAPTPGLLTPDPVEPALPEADDDHHARADDRPG